MSNNKLKRAIEYLSELDNVPSEILHDLMQLEAEKQGPVACASSWVALIMNAAAELEDAANCLRDEDAKRVAIRGANYYRDNANALYTHPQPKQDNTDLDAICQDLQEKTYTQAMRIAELEAKLADAEKQEPYGWVSQHTTKGLYEWQFNKELSGVYKDTAISILPVYTHPQPNVTTSDMKQEHVAKTAKQRHEGNT
jgi:ribosomal protein L11 methylase PrmA